MPHSPPNAALGIGLITNTGMCCAEAFVLCQKYAPPPGYVPTIINPMLDYQYCIYHPHALCSSFAASHCPSCSQLQSTARSKSSDCSFHCLWRPQGIAFLIVDIFWEECLANDGWHPSQGFDSDGTYSLEEGYSYRGPNAPPINPPYKSALDMKHLASQPPQSSLS